MEFNIYVLVIILLGNNIKVLYNKLFLVCVNKYMYNESVGEGNWNLFSWRRYVNI